MFQVLDGLHGDQGPTGETFKGLIDKNEAHAKLAQCVPGTFLMRFSDSGIGGISIAYTRSKSHDPSVGHMTLLLKLRSCMVCMSTCGYFI